MPALELMGRKWLAGTDDMVFPSLVELIVRFIWLILVSVALLRYYNFTFDCDEGGYLVRFYLIGVIVIIVAMMIMLTIIINRSAQGAIWDTARRAIVPRLIVIKIAMMFPEMLMNILGTVWTFTHVIDCVDEHFTNTVVRFLVLFNWMLFALTVFGLALVLDPIGSIKINDGNNEMTIDSLRHRKVTRIWVRRFRWFFCWITRDEHSREAFSQIASLFSSLFRDTDMVPTDIIAGCILLRVKQKRESREQRRLALIAEQRYNCTSSVKEAFAGMPSWMNLELAEHYLQFSMAAYGWPFVMYRYCLTGIFKLLSNVTCCSCFRAKPTVVREDNCCLCNLAGVKYISRTSTQDILFVSFRNHIFQLPFFVVADHKTKSIVISIRGSISMRDIFTDLTAVADKFEVEGLPPDSMAHKGMIASANYVKKELEDGGLLDKAFAAHPDYKLVLTGHSLGAGTSVLLAILLKPKYPDVKVYAFATPAGLLSREAARYTESFVMTIGVGDDFVMRLSIESAEDCRTNMLNVLQMCRLPKYRVYLNGFGYALFGVPSRDLESTWRADRLRTPANQRSSPLLSKSSIIEVVVPTANDIAHRRFSKSRLFPAGKILHITYKKKSKEEKKAAKKSGERSGETFEMRWAHPEDFVELRIMPRMLLDHLPDNIHKTIRTVLDEQITEITMDMNEITIL
ncbi:unnamed protein product [Bemisia tabaci]|uniref:sn-1-specific diacylglycerol lipase n=1 Tax=Bemisia tabaci TaxID=7038 RepID=A0A9P0AK70_BEMTA|nr:PREDICTED: sn1-specific diacylglycerol lipase beta-like [Bemisia tabaci]CAH0394561.1 unnamed protein product [Bemisia tabaci]